MNLNLINTIITALSSGAAIISCVFSYKTAIETYTKHISCLNLYIDNENNLILYNTSDYPIFDVFIFTMKNGTFNKKYQNIYINPKELVYYNVISGNTKIKDKIHNISRGVGQYPIAVIIFKDKNGKYWIKSQDGIISRINQRKVNKILKKNKIFPPYPNQFH